MNKVSLRSSRKLREDERTRRGLTERIRSLLDMISTFREPVQTRGRLPAVNDVSLTEDDESIQQSERV